MASFSGGRTSAFMVEVLLQNFDPSEIIVCFANTGKEVEGTLEFVNKCDKHWGGIVKWIEFDAENKFRIVDFETASRDGRPFAELIDKRGMCPNLMARFCTTELKIRPISHYIQSLGFEHWTNAVGIRYDEPLRWRGKEDSGKDRWETWRPLVEMKTTKKDVLSYWSKMPFNLEIEERNGNCDLCFLKGKAKKVQIIRENPATADWWIEQEKKGKRGRSWFRSQYSVSHLVELANQGQLFDLENNPFDIDIACSCNID